MSWYFAALRKYASFTGRARRTEFWMFTLIDSVIGVALFGITLSVAVALDGRYAIIPTVLQILFCAYVLLTLVPAWAVRIRRLHDVGRSGWYYLINLIPFIGGILLLVELCTEGTRGPNPYGADPKSAPAPYVPVAAGQPAGQPMAVAPFGPQPPPGWPVSPPPIRRNRGAAIAVATVCVVLLVVCFGLAGILLPRSAKTTASSPAAGAPLATSTDGSPSANAAPKDNGPSAQQALLASEYPAEKMEDLDRVCDEDIYYPQSPKRAGKAPHPVVLLIADGPGIRFKDNGYYYSLGVSKKTEQSWASSDPGKVQMVACLDKVSTGKTIRSCRYDDPTPDTLTLLRAGWRLRVHEVATGRKLLDKAMNGDDQKCPSVVMFGPDKKIYAKVTDRAVIAALRNLVNK